jgi:YVTN family beta-propeller protein
MSFKNGSEIGMMRIWSALVASILFFNSAPVAFSKPAYHLIKKVSLPGGTSWDYVFVDEVGRRVYVSHGTQVEVLDADTFEFVATIPYTPGVHGIAVAREFGRGFITAGKSDSVIIFDLNSLKQISEVKVGKKPDAIMYEPSTRRIYAMNGDSDSVSVIDPANGKVVGTVDLGGGPEFAVADGKGNVYVNLEERAETVHVDASALRVLNGWSLAPGKTATALAFDPATRRLFAGCRGGQLMVVVDADTGKIITTAPIGERVDAAAFDSSNDLVFMSNGEGTVSIYHEDSNDKYTLVETVTTNPGSKTMALDPKTHNLFVPANLAGQFTVLVLGR